MPAASCTSATWLQATADEVIGVVSSDVEQALLYVEAELHHVATSFNLWSHGSIACLHRPVTPEQFLEGSELGLAVYRRLADFFDGTRPDVTVRASKSQIALRRGRGFAYLWRPTQYLRSPTADVVLAIALRDEITSPRFKEIAHPAPHVWMHHLEIHALTDVDAEVEQWLLLAADEAA